jgi:tRNA(Ile)-lysidine synthase
LPQNLGVLTAEKSTSTLRCPQPQEQVFVRFHATGYVHIVNRPGGRDIKKIWQRLNIPPWQRARIPLIYFNQTLICAPGLFVTREGASEDAVGWQVNWQKTTGEPE